MLHLGDITKINGAEIEAVDCITGGSPCQDLSIAGKRKGLAGERSGLFMEQLRIIKEMRDASRADNIRPRYMVWENVPGAFSSNKGEDFRAVLEETARVVEKDTVIPRPPKDKWTNAGAIMGNGWSIAWRTMDAQFWGVPQRRRRIALVADFGGESAPEILFERESVSGHSEPSCKERKGVAQDAKRGVGEAVCYPLNTQVITRHKCMGRGTGFGMGENGEPSFTLQAGHEHAVAYSFDSLSSNSMKSSNPHSGCREVEVAKRLDTTDPNPSKNQGGIAVVQPVTYSGENITSPHNKQTPTPGICHTLDQDSRNYLLQPTYCLQGNGIDRADTAGCNGKGWTEEVCYTLNTIDRPAVFPSVTGTLAASGAGTNRPAGQGNELDFCVCEADRPAVTSKAYCATHGSFLTLFEEEKSGALQATDYKDPPVMAAFAQCSRQCKDATDLISHNMTVRRLTPLECERLQGFPDKWTLIPDKKCSDSARYKALGNSIALPQWRYVLGNICEQLGRKATLGSLFDGLGGFPLIWQEINGNGSARWASEIEPFPIAVTKCRIEQEEE